MQNNTGNDTTATKKIDIKFGRTIELKLCKSFQMNVNFNSNAYNKRAMLWLNIGIQKQKDFWYKL